MSDTVAGVRAVWRISCIDRKTTQFFDRDVILDTAAVPPELMPEIMLIAGDVRSRHAILKYRHYFKERPNESREADDAPALTHFNCFCLPDYWEDDEGNPLDCHGMMQIATGDQGVLVLHDPISFLEVGPKPMSDPSEWSIAKANVLDHFIEVADCLSLSEFMTTEAGYSSAVKQDGTKSVIRFNRPNVLLVNSVLAFVRQLVSEKDDLYCKAVDIYLAHCSDEGKRLWVTEQRRHFKSILGDQPDVKGLTRWELLKLFCYAFGLIHRPKPKQFERFRDAVAQHGKEKLTTAFHFACLSIAAEAHKMGVIIRQDLAHWFQNGAAKPDRVSIREVLGEVPKKDDDGR